MWFGTVISDPERTPAKGTTRMTDASPIKLNTGDGIAVSSQPKNSPRNGQNSYIKLNHFKGLTKVIRC